jgi:anti-sigma regulatory factor (Ser/Thr protein kinase)
MTPGQRRLVVAAGALLLLGVALAGVAVLTVTALPLAVALGLTIVALVATLGTRARRGPGSGLPADEHGADVQRPSHPSELCWATRWESAPGPDAVPLSRDRLTAVLAEWGLVGEAIEPTLLVVTELLSNAVDHGRGPVRLAVAYPGEWVHVEVYDGAAEPPRLQPHDVLAARGRGLQLVEALALRWGWTHDPPGKLVWAEVPTEWPTSPVADTVTR